MFNDGSIQIMRDAANRLGVPPAALMAVVKVESNGKIFSKIDGRNEPLIRFEGHYFYRLLPRVKRNEAIVAGLANSRAGRVRNPFTQVARWAMLGRASKIDRDAALVSVSWGIGQVMGVHWRWLGYASIDAMVVSVRGGFEGQLELMCRFTQKSGLCDALKQCDWAGFARVYNGPGFKRNRYDEKMAKAFREFVAAGETGCFGCEVEKFPRTRHSMATLRLGANGSAVMELQNQLGSLGYHLSRDGDFGPATQRMVRRFQRASGLEPDGLVGPRTFEMLMRKMPVSLI